MNRVLLAKALKWSPSSSAFREHIAASAKYGLTEGNYNSDAIKLTDAGVRFTTPRDVEERTAVLREAMRNISLFAQLLDYYDNNKLPALDFLKNVLERAPFNVDPAWSAEASKVFVETARFVGMLTDVGGSLYVIRNASPDVDDRDEDILLDGASARSTGLTQVIEEPEPALPTPQSTIVQTPTPPAPPEQSPVKRHFFIAHGHDQKALAQLKAILNELNIPYVVAMEEANAGRPISQKIADLMNSCYAGIFLFSADEEVKEGDAVVKRPRLNVVFELGAASLLYGQKIVIFKEKGV
ncbi:MAG: nucleotide-binding protein, partial [Candidatus Eremiobacteraeota bacterium]|nr:nucleotide-binding protein [Candidatus Eremiobacteraeota bacterium]